MRVTACDRCTTGWDRRSKTCRVDTGAEHLPDAAPPDCPISDRCQHQLQAGPRPCPVRSKGLVCESALALSGVQDVADHPFGFNACVVASPEEVATWPVD
jgi:hypothetical protein